MNKIFQVGDAVTRNKNSLRGPSPKVRVVVGGSPLYVDTNAGYNLVESLKWVKHLPYK